MFTIVHPVTHLQSIRWTDRLRHFDGRSFDPILIPAFDRNVGALSFVIITVGLKRSGLSDQIHQFTISLEMFVLLQP